MLIKLFDKILRELYRFFHPHLWGHNLQINGIPHIYDIKKLKIGQNVSINADCVLQCYGGVTIGNNVTISDGAKILTRSLRTTNYIENASKREREHMEKPIDIGDGVWVAANAVILPGTHIAKNSIVAAGSIVTKDLTDEACLYGGIPAKRIKELHK